MFFSNLSRLTSIFLVAILFLTMGMLVGNARNNNDLTAFEPGSYQPQWSTPPLNDTGQRLEVIRDYYCFGDGQAGERGEYYDEPVYFSQKVLFAEVFLSGFNMWYTREGNDHEVMQLRMDAWVSDIGTIRPSDDTLSLEEQARIPGRVMLNFRYTMTDEDTGDSDDFNDGCIGYTVLGLTTSE